MCVYTVENFLWEYLWRTYLQFNWIVLYCWQQCTVISLSQYIVAYHLLLCYNKTHVHTHTDTYIILYCYSILTGVCIQFVFYTAALDVFDNRCIRFFLYISEEMSHAIRTVQTLPFREMLHSFLCHKITIQAVTSCCFIVYLNMYLTHKHKSAYT